MSRILVLAAFLNISPSVRVMTEKLNAALREESNAVNCFELYSRKAHAESYHDVGKLFHAAAVSEYIQAENHRAALSALGSRGTINAAQPEKVNVGKTPENLKAAMAFESSMRLVWFSNSLMPSGAPAADVVDQSFIFARDAGFDREKLFWNASTHLGEPTQYDYYVSRISGKIRLTVSGGRAPAARGYTDDYFKIL